MVEKCLSWKYKNNNFVLEFLSQNKDHILILVREKEMQTDEFRTLMKMSMHISMIMSTVGICIYTHRVNTLKYS